jgi:hypothetical protein
MARGCLPAAATLLQMSAPRRSGAPVEDEREVEGWKMADLTNFLDKACEGKDFAELAESPVDALQGLSKADAEALEKALGIKTVRDLATNRFVLWAQAVNVLGHER